MKKRDRALITLFSLLAVAALACNFGSFFAPENGGATTADLAPPQATAVLPVATPTIAPTAVPSQPQTLPERLAAIRPDANGNFSVSVTQAEFNRTIESAIATAAQQGTAVPIQDAQVGFEGAQVVLTGRVTEPLAGDFAATLRPVVADGRLRLEVVNATLSGFPVPQNMLGLVDTNVNQAVDAALRNLPANIVLQSVTIGDGVLTLTGRQN